MRCNEFIENIDLYIDNMLDEAESEKMREHIESCEICRNEYEEIISIVEGLGGLDVEPLPQGFDDMLRERLENEVVLAEKEQNETGNNYVYSLSKFMKKFSYIAASIMIIAGGYSLYRQVENANMHPGGEIAITENSDPETQGDMNVAIDKKSHETQQYNESESYSAIENNGAQTEDAGNSGEGGEQKTADMLTMKGPVEVQKNEIQEGIETKPKVMQAEIQNEDVENQNGVESELDKGENSWQMAAESGNADKQAESVQDTPVQDTPAVMSLAKEPAADSYEIQQENIRSSDMKSKTGIKPTVLGLGGGVTLDMENYAGEAVEIGIEGTITVITENDIGYSNVKYDKEMFEFVKGETAEGKTSLHFIPKMSGQSQLDISIEGETGEIKKTSIKIVVE